MSPRKALGYLSYPVDVEIVEQFLRYVDDGVLETFPIDVVMPGLNGFQATRAITREETTKNIPVFICTTKDQETDKIWGMRQGAKDYIVKPVNGPELIAKIKALG